MKPATVVTFPPAGAGGAAHPARTESRHMSSSFSSTGGVSGGGDDCSSVGSGVTYANQSSLPRLPIPSLEETMERFPRLLRALQTTQQQEETKRAAKEFLEGDGKKLQALLVKYEEEGRQNGKLGSYVEEFWNDSYLAPDCSLVLNLNPFFVLEEGPDPDQDRNQLGRASSLVYAALLFVSTLKRQELTPDAFRTTALCMDQFQSLFGSCRIPVVGDKDYVAVDPSSSHVVVLVKSRMYYFQGLWPEAVEAEQVGGRDNGEHEQERAVVAASRDDILDILQAIVRDVEDVSGDDAAEESAKNAVGVLTTLPRKEWAKARYILLEQSEHNKQVMQVIDSALFVLVLDDYTPSNVDQTAENMLQGSYQLASSKGEGRSNIAETPATVSSNRNNSFMTSSSRSFGMQGGTDINDAANLSNGNANGAAHPKEVESLLSYQTGTCSNRWYDKLQIIVCQNGSAGVNFEHSAIDGHTALRFVSDIFAQTVVQFAQSITRTIYGIGRIPSVLEAPVKRAIKELGNDNKLKLDPRPKRLTFNLTSTMEDRILRAEARLGDEVVSSDVRVLEFKEFGKSFVTSHKMSPDSFVQMAIAVAYYQLYGKVVCQYEPVLTKQFLHGRTEAMRSSTPKAATFCELWCSRTASKEQKVEALREATAAHSALVKECAAGKGTERHLFALRSLAEKYNLDVPSFFSSPAWTTLNHTTLSTSNCGNPSLRLFGFGPVVSDGFGIGYIIKDSAIHFTISSKSRQTHRYKNALHKVLLEVKHTLGNAAREIKVQSPVMAEHKKSANAGIMPAGGTDKVFYSEGFDEYDHVSSLPPSPPPSPARKRTATDNKADSDSPQAGTGTASSKQGSHHHRHHHHHHRIGPRRSSFYLATVKKQPSLDRETLENIGDSVSSSAEASHDEHKK